MSRTWMVWLAIGLCTSGCVRSIGRAIVKRTGDEGVYEVSSTADPSSAPIQLNPVAEGFSQPTDLAFIPGKSDEALVLERLGRAWWVDLAQGTREQVLEVDVISVAEQGLLGVAFHPNFADNRRLFLNYTIQDNRDYTIIAEYVAKDGLPGPLTPSRELLRVEQPFQNHNGGGLAFGPDGMLYVGLGDGGARGDMLRNAQDGSTLLGSMLRLNVDGESLVPGDNPFVGNPEVRDEIYAIGLRNPWRFSFTAEGQLVVADVGQDAWEEVDVVRAGDNLGWRIREGDQCFRPAKDCPTDGLTDPIFTYGREQGGSITGGFVVTGDRAPELRDRYVFGDFVSGRMWSLAVPDEPVAVEATELGTWPVLLSSFGLDASGDLYVLDFGRGVVFSVVSGAAAPVAANRVTSAGYAACAACHGAQGEGSEAMRAPALAGLPADYVVEQLGRYRAGLRSDPTMAPLANALTEEEIRPIAEEVAAFAVTKPEPTLEGDAARGAELYATCTVCHGAQAEGTPALKAPPLVGLQDWYIVAQLAAYASGRRGTDPAAAGMAAIAQALTDENAGQDLAAHIGTLR